MSTLKRITTASLLLGLQAPAAFADGPPKLDINVPAMQLLSSPSRSDETRHPAWKMSV
jgi:hypothetical protein